MLVALGFLAASLLGLLLASAFWSRAVRLTTQRIKQSMPVSEPEIKADRDRLRAEYAIKVHKLETQLDQAKLERARQLIDINRRDASISSLESNVVELKLGLEENLNARRVLEQTVTDRLPKVEARLTEAKRLLFNRDRDIAELMQSARRQKQALEEASSINSQQNVQIERLNTALTTRGGRGRQAAESKSDGETVGRGEIEALRAKTREQASLIDRLLRGSGNGLRASDRFGGQAAAPVAPTGGALDVGADGEMDRLRQDLSEAEAALSTVRGMSGEADSARIAYEREIRGLKARAEDQAGEIARLKAALAAFEQPDAKSGNAIRETKIGLKARLGSIQAQADQQTATIARLRAELAAAHERLARQAAHFMDEMRRVGGDTRPASGQPRRSARGTKGDRRSLAERVSQVRPAASTVDTTSGAAGALREDAARADTHTAASSDAVSSGSSSGASAGSSTGPPSGSTSGPTSGPSSGSSSGQARNGGVAATPPPKTSAEPVATAAAELPKAAGQIPGERRRLRLLDRITGHAKE
jgi:hypothetical protein